MKPLIKQSTANSHMATDGMAVFVCLPRHSNGALCDRECAAIQRERAVVERKRLGWVRMKSEHPRRTGATPASRRSKSKMRFQCTAVDTMGSRRSSASESLNLPFLDRFLPRSISRSIGSDKSVESAVPEWFAGSISSLQNRSRASFLATTVSFFAFPRFITPTLPAAACPRHIQAREFQPAQQRKAVEAGVAAPCGASVIGER